MMLLEWDASPTLRNQEEKTLLMPLLHMMRSRGWINEESIVLFEMPLNGRRTDLATLTKSGMTSAYELKIGSFQRVLEQAIYNRISFDRSWIVLDRRPVTRCIELARDNGIGIIVLDEKMTVVLWAMRQASSPIIRKKIYGIFRKGTGG